VEQTALPEGVKPLDHQTAPLPENPPIAFKKLFALRGRGDGRSFSRLAFSPDGKTIAATRVAGSQRWNDLFLFDLEKKKVLHVLTQPHERANDIVAIAFLPPGDRLASASFHVEKAFLWDARSGKLLDTLHMGDSTTQGVTDLGAFPDGKRVLCCSFSGFFLWDVDAKVHQRLPLEEHVAFAPGYPPVPAHCSNVAIAADGSRFVATVSDVFFRPCMLVWDAKTLRVTRIIPNADRCEKVAIAPNGATVAAGYNRAGGRGGTHLSVWDASSGTLLASGHVFGSVRSLAYSPDGRYLLASGNHLPMGRPIDPAVIGVWEVATGRLVACLPTTHVISGGFALSPRNHLLAVSGPDIDVYDVEYRAHSERGPDAPPTAKP
jgi:WD40 repeat protein